MKIKKSWVLKIAGVLSIAFVLAAFMYQRDSDKRIAKTVSETPNLLVRSSAKTLGPTDAKVHIVEFMDPGCETCRAFHPFVKTLLEKYAGQVRLSIRYLPLHQGADTMVKILEAADRQGKFWETLELMFEYQPVWASHHHPQPEKIWPLLPQAGVDVEAIRNDMNDPAIAAILEEDMNAARTLGIRKTPSFFVNGEPLRQFGYKQLEGLVAKAVNASH